MTLPSSDKPQLLVLRSLMPAQMEQLEAAFTLHRYDQADDPAALLASVGAAVKGVVTAGMPGFSGDMLAGLPALEIVGCASVGIDAIDLPACRERGVHVTNTPDVLNDDVADLGIGLIMNALRRVGDGHDYVRNGSWSKHGMMPLATSLKDKRLGIVGLGRIGQELAQRAAAMKMRIAYHGRNRQDVPYEFYPGLTDLARDSDVLVLLCPGGPQTRHLINAAVLDVMGPNAWLVNLSRGSVVDEAALIDTLQRKAIGGAALDVFENEPHIDARFLELDNVVLSPHHASGTVETRAAMSQLVVDNLKAHFQNKPLLTPV